MYRRVHWRSGDGRAFARSLLMCRHCRPYRQELGIEVTASREVIP